MTKEEYINKRNEINDEFNKKRLETYQKKKELEESYINEHKEFNIGDRVKVSIYTFSNDHIYPNNKNASVSYGYVSGFKNIDGVIYPTLYGEKKDKTKSERLIHPYTNPMVYEEKQVIIEKA